MVNMQTNHSHTASARSHTRCPFTNTTLCRTQLPTLYKPALQFDFDDYVTEQVFAASQDGTRVPMFLIHHRDMQRDGTNPTLLYGYGGFNIPMTPVFAVDRLIWLEMGGVFVMANLRGGGEFGEGWHKAGTVHHKQNVFDDFIACAEYLIEQNITVNTPSGYRRAFKWGTAHRRMPHAAPRAFWRCLTHRWGSGYAALSQIHHWVGMDQ